MEAVRSVVVPKTAEAPPVMGSHRRFSMIMGLSACLETGYLCDSSVKNVVPKPHVHFEFFWIEQILSDQLCCCEF